MTFQTLASIDLTACSKAQLKAFTKLARDQWGRAIDLRSANVHDLIEYLQMYLAHKAATEQAEAPEVEIITLENAEVEIVTYTLSDFQGITDAPLGDWFASCPLTCDVCNYQVCDLPEPEEDFEIAFCDGCYKRCELAIDLEPELELPESFNVTTRRTIDILLQFGTAYGDMIDKEWLQGILKDCSWRATIPGSVTEKLVLSDPIYYGLAGIDSDSIALYDRIVKTPEEFGNIPEGVRQGADFYRNIGSLIGANKIAQIAAYHSIRDNLNYLQQRLGISSLEPRSCAIRDRLFSCQDYDQQMVLLPSDRRILKLEAPRIGQYFHLLITDYQLYHELDDESLEPLSKDFDLQAMMSQSFGCDYAWIYAESFNWEPHSGGGYIGTHTNRLDPDRISLSLDAWDGSDYVSFLRLVAYHPDLSRRPWLAKQST